MNTNKQKAELTINVCVEYAKSKIANWVFAQDINKSLYKNEIFKKIIISILSENTLMDENVDHYVQHLRDRSINTKEMRELFTTGFNEQWSPSSKKEYILGLQIQLSMYSVFCQSNNNIASMPENMRGPLTTPQGTNNPFIENIAEGLLVMAVEQEAFKESIFTNLHYPVAASTITKVINDYILTLQGGDHFRETIKEIEKSDGIAAAMEKLFEHKKTCQESGILTPQKEKNIAQLSALRSVLGLNKPLLTEAEKNPNALLQALNNQTLDAFLEEMNRSGSNLEVCIAALVTDVNQKLVALSLAEGLTSASTSDNHAPEQTTPSRFRPS